MDGIIIEQCTTEPQNNARCVLVMLASTGSFVWKRRKGLPYATSPLGGSTSYTVVLEYVVLSSRSDILIGVHTVKLSHLIIVNWSTYYVEEQMNRITV